MKKGKPDLLWALVILFGLGVVTTGYTQSLWSRSASERAPQQDVFSDSGPDR